MISDFLRDGIAKTDCEWVLTERNQWFLENSNTGASATFDSIESIHALHLTTPKLLQVFHLDPVYWTAAITSY